MPSCIHYHLDHALAVMKAEKDWRKWAPLIEAIPEPAREPCRLWLREEAKRRQLQSRNNAMRNGRAA